MEEENKKDQVLVPMTHKQHKWFMEHLKQYKEEVLKKQSEEQLKWQEKEEKFDNYINGIEESKNLINVLLDDVKLAHEMYLERKNEQFMRRNFVRAFFASIEGHIYRMKQDAILYHENEQQIFKPEEVNLLKEKSYEDRVNKQGNADRKEKDNYISFLPNFRFSIKCYFKSLQLDYGFDFSNNGWECLQRSVEIRNNITHPKNSSDIEIEDSDMEKINIAFDWYIKNITKAFLLLKEKRRSKTNEPVGK